jgi:hypothetical protein
VHQKFRKAERHKSRSAPIVPIGKVQSSAVTAAASSSMTANSTLAAHSVRGGRAASPMKASATIGPVESRGHSAGVTGEAAVAGIARPAVNAVIDMGIVVSLPIPNTEAPAIAKVMKISIIKAMVEMAEEKKRREADVKR